MNLSIQDWINNQLHGKISDAPSTMVAQAMFVRDRLVPLFCQDLIRADLDANLDRIHDLGKVLGTHLCHSRSYGVFDLNRPEIGLRLVMRGTPTGYGSTTWKMSVISRTQIHAPFGTLCSTHPKEGESGGMLPCCFEGFPENLVFGYYGVRGSASHRHWFSLELDNDCVLWAAIHMIMVSLVLIKNDQ